jgi:hypothetical protein
LFCELKIYLPIVPTFDRNVQAGTGEKLKRGFGFLVVGFCQNQKPKTQNLFPNFSLFGFRLIIVLEIFKRRNYRKYHE